MGHRSTDKRYAGDNRLMTPKRVHIDGVVWHLDVGSSHPGAGEGPKGSAVRRLKWHVNWVQNVARQFGLYLWWALVNCEDMTLVREDRVVCTAGVSVVPPGAVQSSYVQKG